MNGNRVAFSYQFRYNKDVYKRQPGHSAVEDPVEDPENEPGEVPGQQPVDEEPDNTPVVFNNPDEMRGVWLVPGTDFLTGGNYDAATVKAAIDSAVADAKNLMMNTIIIDSVYGLSLIHI